MSGLRQPVSKFQFSITDGSGVEKDVTEKVMAALSQKFDNSEVRKQ